MDYKIACLTPIDHIDGVRSRLESIGLLVPAFYATKEEALSLSKICNVFFVNPNKMTYKIDAGFFENSKIKHIVTASTGTNHIDLFAAKNKGISVHSLTKHLDVIERISSTAEHALALTMSLVRNVCSSFDDAKLGNWDYEKFIGRQIDQLTIGVIGFGRLGKKYVNYMRAIGAKVIYSDPQYNNVSAEEIFEKSEVISLHVHLSDSTKHLVNMNLLCKSKKKPFLINTSRGEIVDENALLECLERGIVGGYATDVLEDELGNVANSKLIKYAKQKNNIIITPHIGGMTKEAQEIAYNEIIKIFKKDLGIIDNK